MNQNEMLKENIMELVTTPEYQRIRPIDIARTLKQKFGSPLVTVKDAIRELVEEGELVYAYRDPCSYVEIP